MLSIDLVNHEYALRCFHHGALCLSDLNGVFRHHHILDLFPSICVI